MNAVSLHHLLQILLMSSQFSWAWNLA